MLPLFPSARADGDQVLTCFAAAISLLYMWTAIKARENTTHLSEEERSNGPVPGSEVVPYNAAASACLAVWFFFWLWAYNTSVRLGPLAGLTHHDIGSVRSDRSTFSL